MSLRSRLISRTSVLSIALMALWLGGCAADRPVVVPVPTHPAGIDEAQALRDWPRSRAYYANGDVLAGPTNKAFDFDLGDPADTSFHRRQRIALVAEPVIALGNIAMVPFMLVKDPPWEQRRYEPTIIRPSYTVAAPPEELQRETQRGRRQAARDRRLAERESTLERARPGGVESESVLPDRSPTPQGAPGQTTPGQQDPAGTPDRPGTGGTGGTGGSDASGGGTGGAGGGR